VEAYFGQLVAAVNREVAAHERVVRFAVLERDFDPERELTAKGSYRRKEIERSFAPLIDSLYRSDAIELPCGSVRARLPRWFYRDLSPFERRRRAPAPSRAIRRCSRRAARGGLVRAAICCTASMGDVRPGRWHASRCLGGNAALRARPVRTAGRPRAHRPQVRAVPW
jgi:hypothetical protein